MVPMVLASAGLRATGKFEADDLASLDQLIERWQNAPVRIGFNRLSFVEFLGRAEDAAYIRIGLKERKEYSDALDDRGLDLMAKELPVFPIPVVDAVELQVSAGHCAISEGRR